MRKTFLEGMSLIDPKETILLKEKKVLIKVIIWLSFVGLMAITAARLWYA